MVVRLRDSARFSMASLKLTTATVGVLGVTAFYLYGPPVTPLLNASAVSTCNEMAGANYRSYRLDWVVSARPHWTCWNAAEPTRPAVDMGWWVSTG